MILNTNCLRMVEVQQPFLHISFVYSTIQLKVGKWLRSLWQKYKMMRAKLKGTLVRDSASTLKKLPWLPLATLFLNLG